MRKPKRAMFTLLLVGLVLGPLASKRIQAQCTATPTFQDTYVDPEFIDCNGTGGPGAAGGTGWYGAAWGGGGGGNDTFDLDTNFGTGGSSEDADSDAVCGSIQSAINATLAGGTVHVLVPGVYREALTIPRSMTLRGGEGMDVIIDGGNGSCTNGPAQGPDITVSASNAVVALENLTIRRFATGNNFGDGIRITGSNSSVSVIDCRIQGNEQAGIHHASSSNNLDVIGSEITFNDVGIVQTGANAILTMIDTVVANNVEDGISGNGEIGWGTITVDRSQCSNNGRHGINIDQNLNGTGGALVVHDSGMSHNGTDGIHASITNGNGTSTVAVSDSVSGSNGGDGLHLTGGANHLISVRGSRININSGDGIEVDAAWTLNIVGNMFASNGGNCINNAAATPITCVPGFNQFVPAAGTCMANIPTPACSTATGTQNQ